MIGKYFSKVFRIALICLIFSTLFSSTVFAGPSIDVIDIESTAQVASLGPPQPITISCDESGNEKNVFVPGETAYVKGSGFYGNTEFKIWIQPDPVEAGDVLDPADDPSGIQETVWSTMMWQIPHTAIWTIDPEGPPVTLENWNIIIVKNGEGIFSSNDGIDDFSVVGSAIPNPELPPVVLLGIGLFGIGGYLGFSRLRKRRVQTT